MKTRFFIFILLGSLSMGNGGKTLVVNGGGAVVDNGGGLSEQALLYSALHYKSFLNSCLVYPDCGLRAPLREHLLKVQTCQLPGLESFRFSTPHETPALNQKVYVTAPGGEFTVDRTRLYSVTNEPLRIPSAMSFLSRIYFDFCGAKDFSQSEMLVEPIRIFSDYNGEQVTVGKDTLNLPRKDWIRVRTLYSDLIMEAPQSLLRLSCSQEGIDTCSLNGEDTFTQKMRFKSLSLIQEVQRGSVVQFVIEGFFLDFAEGSQPFRLEARFENGVALEIVLMGRKLELPKAE